MNNSNLNSTTIEDGYEYCYSLNVSLLLGITNSFFAFFGILSNVFICVVILRNRSQLWNTNQYLLVFSLALSDLMTSLISMPMEAISHVTDYMEQERYFLPPLGVLFENAQWYMFQILSLHLLLLMTLERFMAIRFPFYQLKRSHVKIGIIIVWIYSVSCFCFHFFMQELPENGKYDHKMPFESELSSFIVNFILPVFVNISIYLYIFNVVRKQRSRIESLKVTTPGNTKRPKRNNNRIYVYIMLIFCTIWLPFSIYCLHTIIDVEFFNSCYGEVLDSVTTLLTFINNIANACVYGATNKIFKRAARKLIKFEYLRLS